MRKQDDPEGEPRWLNAGFAIIGSLYVLTLLFNLWIAVSTLLG